MKIVENDGKQMILMNNICDVWNMIDKYIIKGWIEFDSVSIAIPKDEYDRLSENVQSEKYMRVLTRFS